MSHPHHHHSHGHGCNDDDHIAPPDSNPAQSLFPYIDHDNVRCLNESEPGQARAVLRKHSDRLSTEPVLESDVDEELLITIPFTGLVQLHSIHIRSTADEHAPKLIKLYKNVDLDFETASDTQPIQTLSHPENIGVGSSGAEHGIVEYAVNRTKFSNMTSLTIYIPENHGEDTTQLAYIGLSGSWQKLSKAPVVAMYEAAANPSDHKLKTESEVMHQNF